MKYKVGDKVKIVSERTDGMNSYGKMDKWLGKVMTINELCGRGYFMKEDADEWSCGGLNGWTWTDGMIEALVNEKSVAETIAIYRKGQDIIAVHKRGKEVISSAKATCSPKDEFYFEVGARIAFHRLVGIHEVESDAELCIEINPTPTPLNDLATVIHDNAVRHGFYDNMDKRDETDFVLAQLMKIVAECGECENAISHGALNAHYADGDKLDEEIADVLIRTLDLAKFLGIDVDKQVAEKMEKNRKRPYMHGKVC